MKQRPFLESFIARPRPDFKIFLHFFSGHHQNYTEAGLEYTTNFESHQVQKYLTCNQKGSSHFGLRFLAKIWLQHLRSNWVSCEDLAKTLWAPIFLTICLIYLKLRPRQPRAIFKKYISKSSYFLLIFKHITNMSSTFEFTMWVNS
jgi:hypothetical protein